MKDRKEAIAEASGMAADIKAAAERAGIRLEKFENNYINIGVPPEIALTMALFAIAREPREPRA